MKNPSSGDDSPFTSSSHDSDLKPKPAAPVSNTPSNAPPSVQKIMAANAQSNSNAGGARLTVIKSSYKASGKIGPLAWPVMLLLALGGGALVGALWHFVAPAFNTLLFTQLALGASLGVLLYGGATLSKVRSARFAAGFGVLGALVVFATFHTLGAWQLRNDILDSYSTQLAASSRGKVLPSQVRARLEKHFTLGRVTQFYWKERYQYGVTLRDENTSSINGATSGTHLAGLAFVALLLGEIGLTAAFAGLIAAMATARRFSEETDQWFKKKRVFGLSPQGLAPAIRAMQAEDWAGAATHGVKPIKAANPGTVFVSSVPGGSTGWVEVVFSKDNQTKTLFEREVPVEVLRTLGASV